MSKVMFVLAASLMLVSLAGCSRVSADAGEQGVLVEKPYFFGHGGVDQTPVVAGSEWVALSTEIQIIDMRPLRYDETFEDLMSADAQPMSFHAVTVLRITDSVMMVTKFGPAWYKNNVQRQFQNFVRNEAKLYTMNDLAIKQVSVHTMEANVKTALDKHLVDQQIPAACIEVTVGRVSPPANVVEQQKASAEQQQRVITESNRKLAEDSRKAAETSRAAADRAYLDAIGLSPAQFVQLETVKLCTANKNCQLFMGSAPPLAITSRQ